LKDFRETIYTRLDFLCVIRKHSIEIHGRRTSVKVEDADWLTLKRIARDRAVTVYALIESFGDERPRTRILELVRGRAIAAQASSGNHHLPGSA
jgi:predicted DNA-binding ribbon-helix-helix protein